MANFTITVTNSVRCFGGGPSSLWNAWNWNAVNWGEGTADVPHAIRHLISEAIGSDAGFIKSIRHLIEEAVGSDTTVYRAYPKVISETIGLSSDMITENLLDGSGYYRVFPGGVTDAEDRATAAWTAATPDTETWSTATAASTTWSDA